MSEITVHAHIAKTYHQAGLELHVGKAYAYDARRNGFGAVVAKMFQITTDQALEWGWKWHKTEQLAKLAAEADATAEQETVIRLTPEMAVAI